LHGSVGIDADASDLASSRGRYAIGVAWQWSQRFALLSDFVGSSGLGSNEFVVRTKGVVTTVKPYNGVQFVNQQLAPGQVQATTYAIPRYDSLDLALGVKVSVGSRGTAFVGAFVPVNNSGLRAPVIPSGGVEFGF
jgi:hypothetical protein